MLGRLKNMKEQIVDKQQNKEKENEIKLLNAVLKREEFERRKENEDKKKFRRDQKHFRDFLAKQIQEKRQYKIFEKEKNTAFLKEILNNDAQDQKKANDKFNKHKQMCIQNLEDISKQIEEKKDNKDLMNENELKINARLLNDLYKN